MCCLPGNRTIVSSLDWTSSSEVLAPMRRARPCGAAARGKPTLHEHDGPGHVDEFAGFADKSLVARAVLVTSSGSCNPGDRRGSQHDGGYDKATARNVARGAANQVERGT